MSEPRWGSTPAFAAVASHIYREYLAKGYSVADAEYIARATAGEIARAERARPSRAQERSRRRRRPRPGR